MKFSIITVVKNDKKNILNTINSVKKQEFKDYEHIIFDGNSTDETKKIIKNQINRKIRFYSKKDSGVYDAINQSIELSRGQYIFLLHSGDLIISKNFLKSINIKLKSKRFDTLSGNIFYYKPQKKNLKINRIWRIPILKREKFFFFKIPHTSLFIRRSLLKEIGKYNLRYKISSDTEMLIRISKIKNLKHLYIDKYFIYMKYGGLSTSMKNVKLKIIEDFSILYKHFGYKFILIYIYKILLKISGFIFKNKIYR